MKSLTLNNLGEKILVESSPSVKISEFLRQYRNEFERVIMNTKLNFFNVEVGLTSSKMVRNGTRLWFVCPRCTNRVGIIYKHPINNNIGCRKCLNLEYRKRRYKGMIESKFLPKKEYQH